MCLYNYTYASAPVINITVCIFLQYISCQLLYKLIHSWQLHYPVCYSFGPQNKEIKRHITYRNFVGISMFKILLDDWC